MSWAKRHKWRLIFLAGLVVFSYFNSLNNEFVSDDVFAIVNSDKLGDFKMVLANPFYFLRPLEYFLIFHLFGKSVVAFRLVNLVFHVLAVWGVYALVGLVDNRVTNHLTSGAAPDCRSLKVRNPFTGEFMALVAAVLFAVHPLGVEAVSWVSAGGYVQAAAFGVWSLVFWMLAIENFNKGGTLVKYYVLSVALLLLALFSTEKSVVIIGLMFLITFLWGDLKRDWKCLLIPSLLVFIWIFISVRGAGTRLESLQVNYYNNVDAPKINFFIQLPVAVGEYLKLFVWPIGLTLYHSDLVFGGWGFAIRVLTTLGLLGTIVWTYFKNKKIFFWLAWFLICLSPTLLPFGLSWIVAERYVYMAMIGLSVVVAMGMEWVGQKWSGEGVSLVLVLLVIILMFRTILRNNDWQTADDLWFSAERYSTLSPQNHNNLGDAYGSKGDLERSRWHFEKAIELNPRYADAMHNLGNVYLKMGDLEKARGSFEHALENNPRLWQSEQALRAIEEYEEKISN